jgi:hypothetical protein
MPDKPFDGQIRITVEARAHDLKMLAGRKIEPL